MIRSLGLILTLLFGASALADGNPYMIRKYLCRTVLQGLDYQIQFFFHFADGAPKDGKGYVTLSTGIPILVQDVAMRFATNENGAECRFIADFDLPWDTTIHYHFDIDDCHAYRGVATVSGMGQAPMDCSSP